MTAFLNVFAMLFATMGPIEALVVFAEKTQQLDGHVRRRIALRAGLVATVIGLLFVAFGQFLMDLFHFSVGALTVQALFSGLAQLGVLTMTGTH